MASNIFNSYAGGNGSYATTYNKIQTLNDDLQNSLIFDTKRHSIWTKGEEYGYSNAIFISDNGSNGNFINGVSISYDKNAYTITYNKGYAFDTLSGTKGDNNLVSNITASNGTITITYIKSSDLSASYSNTAGDADTLDGSHKNELLTNVSLTANGNNTKVSVTVGGTEKNSSLTVPYASDAGTLNGHAGTYFANKIQLTGDITSNETTVSSYKLSVSTTHYIPDTATSRTGTGATSFIASNGFNDENAHYLRDGISILNGLKLDAKKHVVGTYEVIIKETYPTELTNTNVASNSEFGRKITLTTNYNDSYSTVIPFATNTSAGVLKTYSAALTSAPETYLTTTEGRYYASRLNSDNKLITNVPWENFWSYKASVSNNSGSKLTFTYHKYVGSSYTDSTFDVTIPIADASNFGVVKSSTTGTTSGRDYNVQVKSDATMKVNVPWTDRYVNSASFSGNTSGVSGVRMTLTRAGSDTATVTGDIPLMTDSVFGVAKLGDSTQRDISASRVYGIAKDANGKLCVNVPWTDTTVDSVTHHYAPTANTNSALNVVASGSDNAAFGTTSFVTGVNISRDAAGHVTGLTVDSKKLPSLTSTYPTIETKNTNQSYNLLFTDKTSGSLAKSYVNNGLTFNPATNTLSFSGGGLISTGDHNGHINGDDNILYLEGGANGINIYGNSAPIEIKSDDYNIDLDAGGGNIYLSGSSLFSTSGTISNTNSYSYISQSNSGLITLHSFNAQPTQAVIQINPEDGILLENPYIKFKTTKNNLYPQGVSSGSHYENNIIQISNNGIYQRVYFTGTSTYGNLFEVSYTGALKFKRLSQAVNPNLSTSYAVGHGTESNYIDQITVASSPGSDSHTLYVVI